MPRLPKRIGIITSPSGAVLHDILTTLKRPFPAIHVLLHALPVQGEDAAEKIAAMIRLAGQRRDCDVLILARGGGSLEDGVHDAEAPIDLDEVLGKHPFEVPGRPKLQVVKVRLAAEGAAFSAGYIAVPVYGMPMFQNHSFFAGHWPAKECGLTKMDYTKVKCPETEAILKTCMLFRVNEAMDEDYIRLVAKAVRKVAKHYGV